MRTLTAEDLDRLAIGAQFLSCTIDPSGIHMLSDLVRRAMLSAELRLADLAEFAPEDLVVAIGFVSQGLLGSEMPPCGDEMLAALHAVESATGRRIAAVYPLAAANANAIAPLLLGLQSGLPVADADPMGRVFPLISQTTLNAAGVPIGPVALVGAAGERLVIEVADASRAEALVRSATEQLGGWAASAMYPCSVRDLERHGVNRSISRMITLGGILSGGDSMDARSRALEELLGTRRIARGQVVLVESTFGPSELALPAQPSSLILTDDKGRLVRLDIQNEILAVSVDGAVVSEVPDIITILDPEQGSVLSLDDVRVGDVLDVLRTPAEDRWYEPAGLALAGPAAFGLAHAGRV